MRKRISPTQAEEQSLHAQGYELVAGIDEVGRGTLAGPVVAAAVILPKGLHSAWLSMVRDSKQLTPKLREALCSYIEEEGEVGLGLASAEYIDAYGIVAATREAMRLAVATLPISPQFLLVDAVSLPKLRTPHKPIVHGDATCLSIAAASNVAKVARDRLMKEMHILYPNYAFDKHKGYATREHLRSLRLHGPCPIHRKSFAPVREIMNESRDEK